MFIKEWRRIPTGIIKKMVRLTVVICGVANMKAIKIMRVETPAKARVNFVKPAAFSGYLERGTANS